MKRQNIIKKFSFLKKTFVKLCRLFGYEIIDQSNYEVPTLNKKLNETLSIPGEKTITIPMGEVKIKEKIKALKIIFRSSTGQLIMDQNKVRIFAKDKNEYTFRSLHSILKSVSIAKEKFNNLDFEFIVTDTHSKKSDLSIMRNIPRLVF